MSIQSLRFHRIVCRKAAYDLREGGRQEVIWNGEPGIRLPKPKQHSFERSEPHVKTS